MEKTTSFARKLKRLFDERRRPDGTRYSQKEVLESVPGLTRVYLWRLRTGRAARPSYAVVTALADFFGVAPGYFFEEDRAKVPFIKDAAQSSLHELIALRAAGLDKEGQKALLLMIDALRKSKSKKPKK